MSKKIKEHVRFAFFGTPEFAVRILDELKNEGFMPTVVVTGEDKPQGRGLEVTPPPVKKWASLHNIPHLQPKSLKDGSVLEKIQSYSPGGFDVFIVAAYGKFIPKEMLNLPRRGVLNVHPSLLPKLRGASPIEGAILSESETGVTIILLDDEMDHGPIVAQEKITTSEWPPKIGELEEKLAVVGGKLLAQNILAWVSEEITPREQTHAEATYAGKISKDDGEIHLTDDSERNFRKIRAYETWPKAYLWKTANGKKIRVIIKDAELRDGKLKITRVLPEGKKEMSWEDFERGFKN